MADRRKYKIVSHLHAPLFMVELSELIMGATNAEDLHITAVGVMVQPVKDHT